MQRGVKRGRTTENSTSMWTQLSDRPLQEAEPIGHGFTLPEILASNELSCHMQDPAFRTWFANMLQIHESESLHIRGPVGKHSPYPVLLSTLLDDSVWIPFSCLLTHAEAEQVANVQERARINQQKRCEQVVWQLQQYVAYGNNPDSSEFTLILTLYDALLFALAQHHQRVPTVVELHSHYKRHLLDANPSYLRQVLRVWDTARCVLRLDTLCYHAWDSQRYNLFTHQSETDFDLIEHVLRYCRRGTPLRILERAIAHHCSRCWAWSSIIVLPPHWEDSTELFSNTLILFHLERLRAQKHIATLFRDYIHGGESGLLKLFWTYLCDTMSLLSEPPQLSLSSNQQQSLVSAAIYIPDLALIQLKPE
jgi:hypothetical protein